MLTVYHCYFHSVASVSGMLLQGLHIHPNPAMPVAKATVSLPVLQGTKYIFINEGSSFFFQAESVKLTTPQIFSFEILWYLLSQYPLPKLEST